MKHWPSHLFPILVLALLAGASFWLSVSVDRDEPDAGGKFRHTPDAIAENFSVHAIDKAGHLRYHLTGPFMMHYGDDDSSLLTSPVLVQYRENALPLTLTGKQAKVSAKGETVYLWDGVTVSRPASEKHSEMNAITTDLTVHPNAGTASTDSPVEMTQGQSWLHATGMQMDNNTATVILQSRVTGEYFRNREQP
jgi:lipopolysaccharide export system protein LptC